MNTAAAPNITPVVGRIVHFWKSIKNPGQPEAAMVAFVFTDTMVNLTVFDHQGFSRTETSVRLVQPSEDPTGVYRFAEWMPYQKGQAAKTEAAEAALANQR